MTYEEYMKVLQENVVHFLNQGKNPWQSPWRTAENGQSERAYNGINAQLLTMVANRHFEGDPRFYTYEQATKLGYKVKKGQHSFPAYFFKSTFKKPKLDEDGKEILDQDGKPVLEEVKGRPVFTTYSVFNAKQLVGVPKYQPKNAEANKGNPEEAEEIIAKSPVSIYEDQLDRAFFNPESDDIHIPKRTSFKSEGDYFSTVFHEMSHSTGVPARLCRDTMTCYSQDKYMKAKEELVAELTAVMLCDKTGYRYANKNSAAYIESWSKMLMQEDFSLGAFYRDVTQSTNYLLTPENRNLLHDQALRNNYFDKLKCNPIQENEPVVTISCEGYNFISEPRKLGYHDAAVLVEMLSENERILGQTNTANIHIDYLRGGESKALEFTAVLSEKLTMKDMIGSYARGLSSSGEIDESVLIVQDDLTALEAHAEVTEIERDAVYTKNKLEERFKDQGIENKDTIAIFPYLDYVQEHCKESRISINRNGTFSYPMAPEKFMEQKQKEKTNDSPEVKEKRTRHHV